MANPGGTPAPKASAPTRAKAGVQALGGPRAEPRYYNKASGKMETTAQMHAYRPTPSTRASHPQAGKAAPKSWLQMNPGELMNFARGQVSGNTKAELAPFESRGRELEGQEQGVGNRLAGYGSTQNSLLEGIQKGAESSAKTFENRAAENAIKAQGEINTSGQNAITNNSGYVDPQLKEQLQAERANVTGISAAGQVRAGEMGQNESNFMANLRAAAAQRVTEQQGQASARFGTLKGANLAQETKLQAKQPSEVQKLFTNLLGQQEKFGTAREKGEIAREGHHVSRANAEEGNATKTNVANKGNATKTNVANKRDTTSENNSRRTRLSAKERNDITGGKAAAGKPMSSTQVAKVTEQISTALAAFKDYNHNGAGGLTRDEIEKSLIHGGYEGKQNVESASGKTTEKPHTYKIGHVGNKVMIRAAEELWYKRELGPEMKEIFRELKIPEKKWSDELLRRP